MTLFYAIHAVQYIRKEKQDLHHFLSGAGSSIRKMVTDKASDLITSYDRDSAFMFFALTKDGAYVKWVNTMGNVVKDFSIDNPHKPKKDY